MVALLLYAYSRGLYSSRQIARGCEERLDFQAVTALNRPDFRTISDFRKRHLPALADLFKQVLLLCRRAGLVSFGHVALDGTKIKANASKHKAMSYARMIEAEDELAAEISNRLTRPKMSSTVSNAATKFPIGCATNNGDWSASARRRPNSKPKRRRRLRPNRQSRSAIVADANRSIRRERSNPRRSAISPTPTAAS
jgi:hypothetical protein